MTTLNNTIQSMINIVGNNNNGSMDINDLVNKMNIAKTSVFGCLGSFRKQGLGEYKDGIITISEEGMKYCEQQVQHVHTEQNVQPIRAVDQVATGRKGRQADPTSKRAQAEHLLATNSHLRRTEKIKMLMNQVGLTQQGANTYIYNYDKKMKMSK